MNKNFSKSFWKEVQTKYELSPRQVRSLQMNAFGILLRDGVSALQTQVRDAGPFLFVGEHVITKSDA